MVPQEVMPERFSSTDNASLMKTVSRLLRRYGLQLREAAEADIPAVKEAALSDIYRLLVATLGTPPTEFDWRVGVLDGKPLYACKYHMAKGHWQIYNWESDDKQSESFSGKCESVPIEMVPHGIVKTALRICSLIGNGLYGVDLKEWHGHPIVIEVNDNPSIDAGIEDGVGKSKVYLAVMRSLRHRIEERMNAAQHKLQQHEREWF